MRGGGDRGEEDEDEEEVKWKKYFTVTQLFSYPDCTTQILSPCLDLTPQSINTPPSKALWQSARPSLHVPFAHSHSSLLLLIPLSHFNTPALYFLPLHHFRHSSTPLSVSWTVTRLKIKYLLLPPQRPINICLSPLQGEGGERWEHHSVHRWFIFSRFYMMVFALLWAVLEEVFR